MICGAATRHLFYATFTRLRCMNFNGKSGVLPKKRIISLIQLKYQFCSRNKQTGCAPVTAYRPNDFGLYNMIGNVWEWTADRFTNLHSPHPVRNPSGPLNGGRYVAKGGSYLCHASYCTRYRTSSRQSLPPDTTTGNLGFRLARAPKSQKA